MVLFLNAVRSDIGSYCFSLETKSMGKGGWRIFRVQAHHSGCLKMPIEQMVLFSGLYTCNGPFECTLTDRYQKFRLCCVAATPAYTDIIRPLLHDWTHFDAFAVLSYTSRVAPATLWTQSYKAGHKACPSGKESAREAAEKGIFHIPLFVLFFCLWSNAFCSCYCLRKLAFDAFGVFICACA